MKQKENARSEEEEEEEEEMVTKSRISAGGGIS
jgi:hypothetical protein